LKRTHQQGLEEIGMRFLRYFLAVVLSLVSLHAAAQRMPVPIIDLENVALAAGDGRAPSQAQVKQAIQAAAAAKQWELKEAGPASMIATLHVRGKHTVVVDVAYAAGTVSLKYRDSIDMKYGTRDGKRVIHPFYNRWVEDFKEGIRLAATKA
jgi:hypothetical protein